MQKSTRVWFIFPNKKNVKTVDRNAVVKVLKQPDINKCNQYILYGSKNLKICAFANSYCSELIGLHQIVLQFLSIISLFYE